MILLLTELIGNATQSKNGLMSASDKNKLSGSLFSVGVHDGMPTRYYLLANVEVSAYNPVHIEGRIVQWITTSINDNVNCVLHGGGSPIVSRGASAKCVGYVVSGNRLLVYAKVISTHIANLVITSPNNIADNSTYVTTEPEGITWIP